jgi:hypothetical protein
VEEKAQTGVVKQEEMVVMAVAALVLVLVGHLHNLVKQIQDFHITKVLQVLVAAMHLAELELDNTLAEVAAVLEPSEMVELVERGVRAV